jgi:hypothetical protein
MAGAPDGGAETSPQERRATAWLSAAVVGLVIWAGIAKALLFRNLEYYERDLYSFLEMSWSWLYAGRLLHDNVYGAHGAIHNFYLLPLLSPFTIPLGAYGLVLALTAFTLMGALRVARTPALGAPGRIAVLAGLVGPVALFVFDNPAWGFHPELLYPSLAALLSLDLIEGRHRRALVPAGLMLLVKEDGAVLLATLLLVHFAWRLWRLRGAPRDEVRRMLAVALLSLLVVTIIFAAGMTLLALQSDEAGPMQQNAEPRVLRSLKIVARTLAGEVSPFHGERLRVGLVGYALVGMALLLALGRRLPGGVALFLISAPILVTVLTISSAHYRFQMMLWPPRLAPLLGLLVACLAHAVSPPAPSPPRRAMWNAGGLALVSWAAQLLLLTRVGYRPAERLDPTRLLTGRGQLIATLPDSEVSLLRCLAHRLPGGLPVSAAGGRHPFFHRQSIVFDEFEGNAWHPARVRVGPVAALDGDTPEGWCPGPRAGDLGVVAECDLVPELEGCGTTP